MSTEKIAEFIKSMVHQEKELMNHRMSWSLAAQGFLLAALTFAWEAPSALPILVAVIGFLVSVSVGISLRLTVKAIHKLEDEWIKQQAQDATVSSVPSIAVIGLGRRDVKPIIQMLLPWNLLSPVFAIIWIGIAYFETCHPLSPLQLPILPVANEERVLLALSLGSTPRLSPELPLTLLSADERQQPSAPERGSRNTKGPRCC